METNPLLSTEIPFDEEDKYLKTNLILQKAMLLLVERCHHPDYPATLECSLAVMEDDLNSRQMNAAFIAKMRNVLTRVLSACHDVSKEATIARMQAKFEVMDAQLSSEHEVRRLRERG